MSSQKQHGRIWTAPRLKIALGYENDARVEIAALTGGGY